MTERMGGEYASRYEEVDDEAVDIEGSGRLEDMEETLEGYVQALHGADAKMVDDILRKAKIGFEKRPGKWELLLKSLISLLEEDHEDEDVLSGALQDKLTEANDLVEH